MNIITTRSLTLTFLLAFGFSATLHAGLTERDTLKLYQDCLKLEQRSTLTRKPGETPEHKARDTIENLLNGKLGTKTVIDVGHAVERAKANSAVRRIGAVPK